MPIGPFIGPDGVPTYGHSDGFLRTGHDTGSPSGRLRTGPDDSNATVILPPAAVAQAQASAPTVSITLNVDTQPAIASAPPPALTNGEASRNLAPPSALALFVASAPSVSVSLSIPSVTSSHVSISPSVGIELEIPASNASFVGASPEAQINLSVPAPEARYLSSPPNLSASSALTINAADLTLTFPAPNVGGIVPVQPPDPPVFMPGAGGLGGGFGGGGRGGVKPHEDSLFLEEIVELEIPAALAHYYMPAPDVFLIDNMFEEEEEEEMVILALRHFGMLTTA